MLVSCQLAKNACVSASDQLLLAEITEFALRPSRPLTLEQIAFLNKPKNQQQQQQENCDNKGNNNSSSSNITAIGSGAATVPPDAAPVHELPEGPSTAASSNAHHVLAVHNLTDARGAPLAEEPLRDRLASAGPLGGAPLQASSFAEFLYHELPVRFASRVKQLESLPLFHTEPLVMQVKQQ